MSTDENHPDPAERALSVAPHEVLSLAADLEEDWFPWIPAEEIGWLEEDYLPSSQPPPWSPATQSPKAPKVEIIEISSEDEVVPETPQGSRKRQRLR